jgi:hypothetical protein
MQQPRIPARSIPGISLICAILLCAVPHTAFPQECKTIKSVQDSADPPTNNTGAGGHVTGHIWGMEPPPGWSRADKTLFTSRDEYIGAWRNYVASGKVPVINCSGDDPHQVVSVRTLLNKDVIGGYSCKNADCSEKNRVQAANIFLGFILSGGKWILNTAYPKTD